MKHTKKKHQINDKASLEPTVQPSSKMVALMVIGAILLIAALSAFLSVITSRPEQNITSNTTMAKPTQVLLETSMGNIVIEMYTDMPITTGNFVKLVNQSFYDGVIFHRIINNFMIQGGDPTGTGMGGPGYKIKDEFTNHNKNDRGTISMANAGPNTGGSQFFINLVNNNFLDTKHPVFGKVVSGMEVIDAIAVVKTDRTDRPLTPVVIKKATLINK